MVERRDTSLLEFAITASLAVVPIMLGILVLVAFVFAGRSGSVKPTEEPRPDTVRVPAGD